MIRRGFGKSNGKKDNATVQTLKEPMKEETKPLNESESRSEKNIYDSIEIVNTQNIGGKKIFKINLVWKKVID